MRLERAANAWSEQDLLMLSIQIARVVGYMIAGERLNIVWQDLAANQNTITLLGEERWNEVAMFTLNAVQGITIGSTVDEHGPLVPLEEMVRVAKTVFQQWKAPQNGRGLRGRD